ncbi:hypothetical protein ACFXTH_008538 [Malus domestica]
MLPIVSCFRQVDVFLVIETGQLEQARGCSRPPQRGTRSAEIMDVSSNEDHCSSFLSFVDRFVVGRCLDGSSNTLCSKMKLHVLNPLQVVSSRYFQNGEIELVQVRHVPKTEGTKTWLVIW